MTYSRAASRARARAGAGRGNLNPVHVDPLGKVLTNLYPPPNYIDPNNRYNYVLSVLEPTNRLEMK